MQPTPFTPIRRRLLRILAAAFFPAIGVQAITNFWANPSGGDWNIATNWSTGTVPKSVDDVMIALEGTYTVRLKGNTTVASVTLGGAAGEQTLASDGQALTLSQSSVVNANGILSIRNAALSGAGELAVTGVLQCEGATFQIALNITSNGMLEFRGDSNHRLNGAVNSQGHVVWSGDGALLMNDGRISVLEGATFEVRNDSSIVRMGGRPVVVNAGLIQKTAGTNETQFLTVPLHNSGTVEVQSGVVSCLALGTLFSTGSRLIGSGANRLAGGSVTLDGAIYSENLEITGSPVTGTNVISGTLRWTSGSLGSGTAMTIATNGTLLLEGPADKRLDGTLENRGHVVWSGDGRLLMNGGRFNNLEDGTLEVRNDSSIVRLGGGPAVVNAGLIQKTAGTNETQFLTVPLLNSGTVEVKSGAVSYLALGTLFSTGSRLIGPGTNRLAGGSVTLDGAIYSENLEITGAPVTGTNLILGTLRWTSGSLGSGTAMTIATNGTLLLEGPADKRLDGTLENRGRVVWSGDGRLLMNGGRFNNLEDATLEVRNDSSLVRLGGGPVVVNAGLIQKTAGTNETQFLTVPLLNSGTVEVQSGAVSYLALGTLFSTGSRLIGSGTNRLAGGSVTLDGAIYSENLEITGAPVTGTNLISGTLQWTSGSLSSGTAMTIATNGTLRMEGPADKHLDGTLENRGQVVWPGTARMLMNGGRINNLEGATFATHQDALFLRAGGSTAFSNSGLFRKLASGGVTTLSGVPFDNRGTVDVQGGTILFAAAYTQAAGRLNFGLTDVSEFGRMQLTGNAPLSGTLSVNLNGSFLPRAGDSFQLMAYSTRTGAFTDFDLPPVAAWQTDEAIYGTSAVTLTVLNARPTLALIPTTAADEELPLSLPLPASDPDLGQTLTYRLIAGPDGATVVPATGVLAWTPTEAQGPSTNRITVEVTDDGVPALSHRDSLLVQVNEVNQAPALLALGSHTVNELTTLVLTNSATDPDIPANALSFNLVSAPAGVTLDPASGVLTWTPTEAQGPSTNTVTVAVTDANPDAINAKHLSAKNSFTLLVREVNQPPTLAPVPDHTIVGGLSLVITNSATDPDLPASQLTFRLVQGPSEASLDSASGVLRWLPALADAPSTNAFTVRVTDRSPEAVNEKQLSDEKSFRVAVMIPPSLTIVRSGEQVMLRWPAVYGSGCLLQSTTNLASPVLWTTLTNTSVAAGDQSVVVSPLDRICKMFRLELRQDSLVPGF